MARALNCPPSAKSAVGWATPPSDAGGGREAKAGVLSGLAAPHRGMNPKLFSLASCPLRLGLHNAFFSGRMVTKAAPGPVLGENSLTRHCCSEGIEVLRLRSPFASRSGCCAQDDKGGVASRNGCCAQDDKGEGCFAVAADFA